VGGHERLVSAELYDPASGTWSATASMVDSRGAYTATLLPMAGLVAGGIGFRSPPGSVFLAFAELYDPAAEIEVAPGRLSRLSLVAADYRTETRRESWTH
jgi:hypothetical protein